jgi:hypothetical protein
VIELLILGVLLLVGIAVFGLLGSVLSLVFWVLFLPFHLLGLVFRGLGVLLALPFILLAGLVGIAVFGAGLILFLLPALPLVLLVLAIWWLMRRRSRAPAATPSM